MKYLYDTPTGSHLFDADSDDEAMKYVADLPQELQFQIGRVAKVLWERKSFAMGAMDPKTYGELMEKVKEYKTCPECDGAGYLLESHEDNAIPPRRTSTQRKCEDCKGTGKVEE